MTNNRRIVTIDIETLPAAEPVECLALAAGDDQKKAEELLRKTSLNGDFGRILCIGYTDERPDGSRRMGVIGFDRKSKTFHLDERRILERFWNLMSGFNPQRDRLVGHNIFEFDLRFILKRSRIYGVSPTCELSFRRYANQPVYDTMCEWECWSRDKIKLENLAAALGLPTSKSEEVCGSKIAELFAAGRHEEIRDYCLRDVRLTREIYRRMTFCEPEDLSESREFAAPAIAQISNQIN